MCIVLEWCTRGSLQRSFICVKDHPTFKKAGSKFAKSQIFVYTFRQDVGNKVWLEWHAMAFVGVSANKVFNKAAERRSNWTFKGFFRDQNDGRFEAVTKNGFLDWAVPNFDNEFSVKSCCSWEMEDLIVQCKCKKVSEVKWLPVASDVEIVFFGFAVCTLWSAMNGTCLMPGMFVALNKWPQSWQSLEQQNLSCKNAFPSPLCTLEPGWNYGPFTRFWLFVQKARLQSGGFQRPSWFARAKNHKTAVGGSWWWLPSNKTQSFWFTLVRRSSPDMGLRKVNGRVGKKLCVETSKNETFGIKWWKFHFGYQICWSHLKFWKIETEYHHKLASSTHVTTLCYEACFLCRR